MHINSKAEFEELVSTIKVPLLIFLTNKWNVHNMDFKKELEEFKKYINILEINIDNCPELLIESALRITPSTLLYKNGKKEFACEGANLFLIKDLINTYGVNKDEGELQDTRVEVSYTFRPYNSGIGVTSTGVL